MSTRSIPDFESHPTLDAWLALGPTELSDRVVERARAEIHGTPRRGTWRVPWTRSVERPKRAAVMLAAVVVVVIALIGVSLRLASTPAVGTQPSPSPSAKTNSLRPTGSMSIGRLGHTATRLLDGRVLVAGGSGWVADGRPTGIPSTVPVITGSAELYDPTTGEFTVTGPMTTARAHHTATLLLNGRVLITGGGITGAESDVDPLAQGFALNSAELYDPATGQFTATGSMGAGRLWASAVRLKDGRVLIVGGSDSYAPNNTGPVKTAEIYDPTTGRFTPAGSFSGGSFSAPIPLADGRVLGLTQSDAGGPSSIVIYDPRTATFSSAGSLPGGYDNAAALADGRLLLIGGLAEAGVGAVAQTLVAQLYDPATGMLRATGTSSIEFQALTTTLLADGTVLLDGFTGRPDGSRPRATFIYDPATETFDPATEPPPPFTPPTQAQVSGTATLLLDGRVLIVGGGGNVGRTRASKTAELFQ